MAKSKYKHVRRNGRSVFIDTTTGKEVPFGSRPYKSLLARLKALPQHVVDQTKRAATDIGDNIVYSDRLDNKGRLQTRAQARVNTPHKGPGGDPSGSGRGQAQQRTKKPKPGSNPERGAAYRTGKRKTERQIAAEQAAAARRKTNNSSSSSSSSTSRSRSSSKPTPTKPTPTKPAATKPAATKKSKTSTYKAHGSDLHIGRHRTLAEHRAAVAAQKKKNTNKPSSSNSTAKKVSRLAQVLAGKKGLASKKKDRRMSGRLPSNRNTA